MVTWSMEYDQSGREGKVCVRALSAMIEDVFDADFIRFVEMVDLATTARLETKDEG